MGLSRVLQRPPGYVVSSMLCALSGFSFGIETSIIGPILVMDHFKQTIGGSSHPTVQGLIVSSLILAAAFSSLVAGRLADAIGRVRGIAVGTVIFAIGAALQAGSINLSMFIVGRVIEGIGEGLYVGPMIVISTVAHTTGPQRRNCTCLGQVGDSPADREKIEASATESTSDVDNEKTGELTTDESATSKATSGARSPPEKSKQVTIIEALSDPGTRPQLLSALFLMCMVQLSGIDGVLFYAPLVFRQAGLASNQASFLASGVSGIVIFAVTIPATIWADSWGRRPSLILGGAAMAVLMFLIGGLYAGDTVHENAGAGRWIVIVAIYVYIVIFCISWAIHVKVFAAEIQPKRTRATATGMAYVSYSLSNFLVALIVPIMLAATSYGAYILFGGCLALTAVVCWLYMPETRGRSLDEIQEGFHHKGHFQGIRRRKDGV